MTEITCPMCGFHFDPAVNRSCTSCPLQPGCQLVCCPNCGYEAVDPDRSTLARTANRLFRKLQQEKPTKQTNVALRTGKTSAVSEDSSQPIRRRLTELSPGTYARLIDFDPNILSEHKAQLQAFGVIPGYALRLQQQKPVTVIQVDHTELAFEYDLAKEIFVEEIASP